MLAFWILLFAAAAFQASVGLLILPGLPLRCPYLSDPKNGDVRVNDLTAIYICNSGYLLMGPTIRRCTFGSWSGSNPKCILGTCPSLAQPENGAVYPAEPHVPGVTAIYGCDCLAGYTIVGSRYRTCKADYTWSGEAPYCKFNPCPSLSDPENGSVRVIGTSAYFTCDPGHQMIGLSIRKCMCGTWTGPDTTCRDRSCPALDQPENGRVSWPNLYHGSIATYSCDSGYELSGRSIRACREGAWEYQAPTCKLPTCMSLSAPLNGGITFTLPARVSGSVATYSCNPGYELVGQSTRTCQTDLFWSGQPPSCTLGGCPDLPPFENGEITGSIFLPGFDVTYNCIFGYELVGDAKRTCMEDFTWSGSAPICKDVSERKCPTLFSPEYGSVTWYGLSPGSIATYRCNSGYQLIGASIIRSCTSDYTWDGSTPVCVLSPNIRGLFFRR